MNSENVWIALIGAAGGIATALGFNKIIPAIIVWFNERSEQKKKDKATRYEEIVKLNARIELLENELDKHRAFEVQTRSTLNAMLPLMKEMMKDHPNYITLLEQLEKNIVGKSSPADGQNNGI